MLYVHHGILESKLTSSFLFGPTETDQNIKIYSNVKPKTSYKSWRKSLEPAKWQLKLFY